MGSGQACVIMFFPPRWVIVINIAVVFVLGFRPENDGGDDDHWGTDEIRK